MDYTAFLEIVACTAIGSFHFAVGACLSFSAVLIPQLEAPDSDIKVTKDDISWIASLITLIMPLGAFVTGILSDKLGRLNTIRLTTIPYTLGWICIAKAQDIHMIILGRLLTGFSMALASNPAFVYITEVSRSEYRGSLLCLAPSMTSLAMVIVYIEGVFLHWRTIAWLSPLFCLLPLLALTLWVPESPMWLLSKGKPDKALKSLQYLHRRGKNAEAAEQQLAELVAQQSKRSRANDNSLTTREFIKSLLKPTCWKPLFLLTIIFMFQQVTGIYITIFYTVSFFEDIGASLDPFVSSVGIGVVRLVMGIITTFLMKSFGRRPLFMLSGIGMAVCMFISGYCTKEIAGGNMEKNIVPLVCVLIYMSVGVLGFMSIPWTMTAEVYPTDIRGILQGATVAIANIISFAVLKGYPFLAGFLGGSYAVQWLFCAMSILATVFVFIFVPETHRKELLEIQDYFKNHTVYILSKSTKPMVFNECGEETIKLKVNGEENTKPKEHLKETIAENA